MYAINNNFNQSPNGSSQFHQSKGWPNDDFRRLGSVFFQFSRSIEKRLQLEQFIRASEHYYSSFIRELEKSPVFMHIQGRDHAPLQDSKIYLAQAYVLSQQGNHETAETVVKVGLYIEENLPSPRNHILTKLSLQYANILNRLRKYSEVEQVVKLRLNAEGYAQPPRPKALAKLNLALAYSMNGRGEYNQAENAAQSGIMEAKKLEHPKPSLLMSLFWNLAYSLNGQKEYKQAENAAKEGIMEARKVQGLNPVYLEQLNISLVCALQGAAHEATDAGHRAVALVQEAPIGKKEGINC